MLLLAELHSKCTSTKIIPFFVGALECRVPFATSRKQSRVRVRVSLLIFASSILTYAAVPRDNSALLSYMRSQPRYTFPLSLSVFLSVCLTLSALRSGSRRAANSFSGCSSTSWSWRMTRTASCACSLMRYVGLGVFTFFPCGGNLVAWCVICSKSGSRAIPFGSI